MTDHEVERRLGYTPCICGVLDGSWHSACYKGKTQAQVSAAYKVAFKKAKVHLQTRQAVQIAVVIDKVMKK